MESPESVERPVDFFQAENIAVVGGGPAGATVGMLLARAGKRVTCYDERNVLEITRPACSGCAGLLQDSCLAALESMGLSLPEEVVQRRLRGFVVHLPHGRTLAMPVGRMVSVYRGFGPMETAEGPVEGFDAWLLGKAIEAGVSFRVATVRRIEIAANGVAHLSTSAGPDHADFVIGAFGHNRLLSRAIAIPEGEGLDEPTTQRSAVFEFSFGRDFCRQTYGDWVHVIIVTRRLHPDLPIWFAAFVPKQEGSVTVVLLGRRHVTLQDAQRFFTVGPVRGLIPDLPSNEMGALTMALTSRGGCLQCVCVRNTITTTPPARFLIPTRGGIALVGDAGATRPFKNGIGAAIDNGIHLARSIVDGMPEDYRRFANRCYPPGDFRVALQLIDSHERFLSRKPVEALIAALIERWRVPFLSQIVHEYTRHMLLADIPYRQILPWGIRHIFRVVHPTSWRPRDDGEL